ncbi:Magnesium transport protein CorA [Planctomycetes bacterium K23_9]|uniref:Magnesium transport protein CorA n=1 Tax=Stieleria marina TaxID=1930275 RepID=A0A517P019_9BACT|nr:Magnesium transport protein CorA [Planctomycetes bacterium K23_9]
MAEAKSFLDEQSVTWINVHGLGDAETFHQLIELFGLHRLALEDVVNTHQRPKVEMYSEHLFIVLRMVSFAEHLENEQVSVFLGKNYVLTIHERDGDCFEPVRTRLRESRGQIRGLGPDYLAYALIDAIIDGYFPMVDHYGERMEQLDDDITAGHSMNTMDIIHNLRSDLMALRRAIRPLRDALNQIKPDDHSMFKKETHYHLRDCYDHTVQIIDLLDNYRELCANLRDYHMSIVSNRMNEVMKVLTITGTIFIPLTFIAGIYGMNFNTNLPGNMPELNWPYGYLFAWLLMLAIGLGLLVFVWRKGWLASTESGLSGSGLSGSEEHRNENT